MQAPQTQSNQGPGLAFLPSLVQFVLQTLGFAAVLLIITQNVDIDFSAKDVHTKVHYKGNVLVDMAKKQE